MKRRWREVKAKARGGRSLAEQPSSSGIVDTSSAARPACLFSNGLDWRLQPWARRETILIYPVWCPSGLDVHHKFALISSCVHCTLIVFSLFILHVVLPHETSSLWILRCILSIPYQLISTKSWSLEPETLQAVLLIIWVTRSMKYTCGLASSLLWSTSISITETRIIWRNIRSLTIFKPLDLICQTRSSSETWRCCYLPYRHRL